MPLNSGTSNPLADHVAEAQRWLRFARDDAVSARLHVATSLALPHQACYYAQQAVEKTVKAVLILYHQGFPKTHDLVALATLLPPDARHVVQNVDLSTLTAWVTVARYPSDLPDPTATIASESVVAADLVVLRVGMVFHAAAGR